MIASTPLGIARDNSNWIQTFTGKQFWPHDPRVEDVDIIDIAHALAMKCRYTGHCRRFYSVGEHSILVAKSLPDEHKLWGLLHDATEAYLPDVARPLKPLLQGFKEIEARLMRVIAERFGLAYGMSSIVKTMDTRMLTTERHALMAKPPVPWRTDEDHPVLPEIYISCWPPEIAKKLFLQYFEKFTGTVVLT